MWQGLEEKHSLSSAAYGARGLSGSTHSPELRKLKEAAQLVELHCTAENDEVSCVSEAIKPGGLAGKTERSKKWCVNLSETHPREDGKELFEARGSNLRPMLCRHAAVREM